MQEALDLTKESRKTLALYGVGEPKTDSYARRCVMARRLVERGVRFVQLYTPAQMWDTHHKLSTDLRDACEMTGTAFFFKQWGGRTPKSGGRELDGRTWDQMP